LPLELIQQLSRQGLSVRSIRDKLTAQHINISIATVHNRLKKLGTKSLKARNNSCTSKKKLSDRAVRYAVTLVQKHNERSGRRILKTLKSIGHDVSYTTQWRQLRAVPTISVKRPRHRPYMTTKQKKQRVDWARQFSTQHIDWKRVFFADEKVWSLDGPARRPRLYTDIGDPPLVVTRKLGCQPTVAVWGAFSCNSVAPLVFVKQHMCASDYCKVIADARKSCPSFRRATLIHDRHPAHRAAETKRWMATVRQTHSYFLRRLPT